MLSVLTFLAVFPVAYAQPQFELIEGESFLADCVESQACGDWSMDSIANLVTNQSYALQHLPSGSSAIRSISHGPSIEIGLDTLLGVDSDWEPNAFRFAPRLALGTIHHEVTESGGTSRIGLGTYLIPPVTLQGLTLFSTGGNVSFLQPLKNHFIGIGGGLTYSWTHVSGVLFEGPEDLEALGALPPGFDVSTYVNTCTGDDCMDILSLQSIAPGMAVSVEPTDSIGVHIQAGAAWFQHQMMLGFEQSKWQQLGGYPQWQVGLSLRPSKNVQIGLLSASLLRLGPILPDTNRMETKFQATVSYHWRAHYPLPSERQEAPTKLDAAE